jgi:hypothetical protein
VVILVFALGAIDGRIREHASMLVSDGLPLAGVSDVSGRAGGMAFKAVHFARSWSGEHIYLTIFSVAGVVLLAAVRRL